MSANPTQSDRFTTPSGHPLPHDLPAERGFLGAILIGGEATPRQTLQLVDPDELFDPRHRRILEELREVACRGEPFDVTSFAQMIHHRSDAEDFGGALYVSSLGNHVRATADTAGHAQRIHKAADQRRALLAMQEGAQRIRAGEEAAPLLVDALARSPRRWRTPVPLASSGPLPTFPLSALPAPLDTFAEELARALQVPTDAVGVMTLAALATALARCFVVVPWTGWEEPVNVYALVGLPPASLKSAVLGALRRPFDEYEREEAQRLQPAILEAIQDKELKEQRLAALRKHAVRPSRRARKEGAEDAAPKDHTEEMRRIARELSELSIPAPPSLIMDDVTPERLALAMKEQGGRIAVWSAEGSMLEVMFGRYNKGTPNLDVFLQGHAGDALKVDRLGREPIRVDRATLTIAIMVQPSVLAGLSAREGFAGRGGLARWMYALPTPNIGYRRTGAPPVSEWATLTYNAHIHALLKLGHPERTERLGLDEDALQVFQDFRAEVEPQLREDGGALGDLQDWGGKLCGLVLRIAGLMHLAKATTRRESWARAISRATLEDAIRIGRWATAHARAAYTAMGTVPAHEDARRMLTWLQASPQVGFSAQEAFQATRGRLKTMERVRPALRVLQDHGYIRPMEEAADRGKRAGRPPSPRYEVNPHLYPPRPQSPQSPQPDKGPDSGDSGDCREGA